MDPIWSFLMFVGSSLCHQIPERSYSIGDLQMPLCARCIGIHVGFLFSSMFIWTGSRRFASNMQAQNALIVLALAILSGFGLALFSYAGLGFNDNTSRTISGLLIGLPIPFIVVPFFNMLMFPGRNKSMALNPPRDWAKVIVAYFLGATVILLATSSIFLFYTVAIIGIAGLIVFIFTMVSLLVAIITDEARWPFRNKLIISSVSSVLLLLILAIGHSILLP